MYKVNIGIRKNHTGQNDSYNGSDLYNNCTNRFGFQMAPIFVTKFVLARAKQLPAPLCRVLLKPHHTSQNIQHSITQTKTPPPVSTPPPLPLQPLPPRPATATAGNPPHRQRRRMIVLRHLTKRLHDPESDRALCSAPLPPLFWVKGTTTTRTGWPTSSCPPATGLSWR